MATNIAIVLSQPSDLAGLDRLYPEAFPDEDLLPLVHQLLKEEYQHAVLSLVAKRPEDGICGHVMFTIGAIKSKEEERPAVLLGPLCVRPSLQGRGIGTALVQEGLRRLRERAYKTLFVLGSPTYYGRFGFHREDAISPLYPLPTEWKHGWQSLDLQGGLETSNNVPSTGRLLGTLTFPEPWMSPSLWLPPYS